MSKNNIKESKRKVSLRNLGTRKATVKKDKKAFFARLFLAICIVLMISSLMYMTKYFWDIKKANDTSDEVTEIINEISDEEKPEKKQKYSFDMSKFYNKNADSKFVLNLPVLDIKNVVVQASNNDYYLNHDFNKNYSLAGWLFGDYRNKLDGTDKNIVVYGHNMRDGKTMFSPLTKFSDKDYLSKMKEEEKIIEIQNEKKKEKYKIFSVYHEKDANINISFPSDDKSLENYTTAMKKRSMHDFSEDTSEMDQMLTLLTCGRTNYDRVVVHAMKVNE